jgi:hypothetical protein
MGILNTFDFIERLDNTDIPEFNSFISRSRENLLSIQ